MGVNCARCSEDLSHTLQGVLILYSLEASSAPDKFSKPRRQPQPRQEWMQGLWGTSGPVWVRKVLAASKPLLWLPTLCWRSQQNLASFGTFLWGTPMNFDRLCQENGCECCCCCCCCCPTWTWARTSLDSVGLFVNQLVNSRLHFVFNSALRVC